MTADELYAWEVANLPHIAVYWTLPVLAVLTVLGWIVRGLSALARARHMRRLLAEAECDASHA